MTPTDHGAATSSEPPLIADPQGHAALLLVESLIHGLCEKAILTTREAVEIVERAISVQHDYAKAAEGDGAAMWHAHRLLQSIVASLAIDDDGASSHQPSGNSVPS